MNDPVAKAIRREAFGKLDFLLNQPPNEEAWVIEILSEPILPVGTISIDDHFIGINKKTIQLAFIEACVVFQARHAAQERLELKREKDVDLASRVIWLHDPEHLTASNYRKKTLEKHKKPVLFKDELKLLVSILNSPLHRQSKSPTLWYHRYWCVKKLLTLDEQNSADDAAIYMQNLITEELGIVRKAAEQHPCNYYAWQYGRKVLTLLDPTCEMQILSEQCVQTFAWCRNHPSDISAFSFLLFIMKQSQDSVDIASVINQTLDWMRHLQWQGEAAWHFLRSLAVDVDLRLDIRCRDSIKQLVGGYFDKIIANRPSWQSQWEFMGTIAADLDRGHQDKSERP